MNPSIVFLIVVLHFRLYQIESCQSATEYAMNAVQPAKRKTSRYGEPGGSARLRDVRDEHTDREEVEEPLEETLSHVLGRLAEDRHHHNGAFSSASR